MSKSLLTFGSVQGVEGTVVGIHLRAGGDLAGVSDVERVEAIWETKPRLQVSSSNWSSVTVTVSTILSLFDPIWTSNI